MFEDQAILRLQEIHRRESHQNLPDRIYQIDDAISVNVEKRKFICVGCRLIILEHI